MFDQQSIKLASTEDHVKALEKELDITIVAMNRLRLQHETYVSDTDAKIESLDESKRSSNDKWQSELELADRSAAAASEQNAATIAGLRSKIRKLRKEREVRILGIPGTLV